MKPAASTAAAAVAVVAVLAVGDARGEDAVVAPVRVQAEPESDHDADVDPAAPQAERALDDPAFVTVVPLDAPGAAGGAAGTAELLARAPGVSLKSYGGLGAFASISVRGAPAAETALYIDGVPLSRLAYAAVDLGAFDPGTFGAAEIYRGGVPVLLGGAALGGAVELQTGLGPRGDRNTRLVLGAGSFGARRGLVTRGDRLQGGRLLTGLAIGYAGADGDYRFFDDNGTPLNLADDGERTRENNGYDQLDAAARLRWRPRAGLLAAGGARFGWKTQGVPGPAGAPAFATSLATWRLIGDGRVERQGQGSGAWSRLRLGAGGWGLVEAQRFLDPDGEIGLAAQDARYLTVAGGGLFSAVWTTAAHTWTLALEPRLEWFDGRDHGDGAASAAGSRWGGGLSLADEILLGDGERVLLVPAIRLDLLATRPERQAVVPGEEPAPPRTDWAASPRLALRVAVTPALSLKASAGRYFRPPTLIELYGDRGYLVGDPALSPEEGTTADLGLVVAPRAAHGPLDRLYLEGALFASRPSRLIAWVPTSGHASVARNLGDARIGGVEAAAGVRLYRAVSLTASYTFVDSRQLSPLPSFDGKALPGRPRHELYLRADAGGRAGAGLRVDGWVDLSHASGNFLDAGNLMQVPARRFLGAGLRVAHAGSGLALSLEARNLLDERVEEIPLDPAPRPGLDSTPRAVADALGYPLPGRSFMATVELDF